MNKKILLLSALAMIGFSKAQIIDQKELSQELEAQKISNDQQFEAYWSKLSATSKSSLNKEALKSKVAFFAFGKPAFWQTDDTDQIANQNVDFLTTGQITGFPTMVNGTGLTIHIFDGGRVYAKHKDFGGTATTPSPRITNAEAATVPYSAHSTAVTGMMGGVGNVISNGTVSGNTKGMAPGASFVSYTFGTTTLPGNTATSSVFQKIQLSSPKLSNHSYGYNPGWEYHSASSDFPYTGWYYGGKYDSVNDAVLYDLNGTYYSSDQNYDLLVSANPTMVIVKSAGNSFGEGPNAYQGTAYFSDSTDNWVEFPVGATYPPDNCSTGFDCIGPGSLAKNIIVVGATDKILNATKRYTAATDVVKSGYSSAGPRDDGGIKPDIAGVGTNIFSASSADTVAGSESWANGSGTSYSAPQITGIIGLWDQIYQNLFGNQMLNANLAKALLLHSAQEAGPAEGPDAWYGWGFADAKRGAELIVGKSNGSVIFQEQNLSNGSTFSKTITASANGPLKATITWVDPAGTSPTTIAQAYNNPKSKLINDLDLRVKDLTTNTTTLPFKLNLSALAAGAVRGDNTVDNVEQVLIPNAVAGRQYQITVTHKRTLQSSQPQTFALLAENLGGAILGTSEVANAEKAIAIYPTITSDVVNVLTPGEKSKITVYDNSGKILYSLQGSGATAINVGSYPKGTYLVTIETPTAKVTKRFIKE